MMESRIVFAGLLSWRCYERGARRLEEEYATVMSRVPEGTEVLLGRTVEKGGERSEAFVVLRGRLATIGEVKSWFELEGLAMVKREEFVEVMNVLALQVFVEEMYSYWARQGETCGQRIVVKHGDAETLKMLELLRVKGRSGRSEPCVEKLTERMKGFQMERRS